MEKSIKRINYYIAALGAGIVTFVFQYISDKKNVDSILMYLQSCVLCVVSFGICYFFSNLLFSKIDVTDNTVKRVSWLVSVSIIILSLIWMYITYSYEIIQYSYYTKDYNRHIYGYGLWFVILILGSFLLYSFAKSASFSVSISKLLRFGVAAVFVFLQGKCLYHPNLFRGGEGIANLVHLDAYTASIVNISNGAAYSPHFNANYGRHGFFYLPLVKFLSLFMNRWFAVSLSIAIIGALMFTALYILLNKLIDNDIVFILTVIASGMPAFEMIGHQMVEVYYQVLPHRMLLQVIGLVGFYYIIRNNTKRNRILMWIVVTLGLIWNLETGIVLLITWSLLDITFKYLQNSWKQMVQVLFMIPIVVFSAYMIMNLLNLLCGGEWLSFGCFGYPYLPNSECSLAQYCKQYLWIVLLYFAIVIIVPRVIKKDRIYRIILFSFGGVLILGIGYFVATKLILSKGGSAFGIIYNTFVETYEGPFSGDYLIILLLLLVFCYSLPRIVKRTISDEMLLGLACSILGLGCLTYHFEYTIPFSLILVLPETLFIFAHIFDKFLAVKREKRCTFSPEMVLAGLVIVFISCMVIETVSSFPTKWKKESEGIWRTDGSNEFVAMLNASLPDGTMCFGIGVPLVCAYMDRDTKIYVQERSNPTQESQDFINNLIESEEYEYIFTLLENSNLLEHSYDIVETYDYMDRGEFVFGLFKIR